MVTGPAAVWFPEPVERDVTSGFNGETMANWLKRSTLPRARAARKFVNYNLSCLPAEWQQHYFKELNRQWDSPFFELIVARTLQALGAELEDITTLSGKRPDFLSKFENGSIVVEATVPDFDKEVGDQQRNFEPLLDIIKKEAPGGSIIRIKQLPALGPADSKKVFKKAISQLMGEIPSMSGNPLRLECDLPGGSVIMDIECDGDGGQTIVTPPPMAWWPEAVDRIKKVVAKKREQVRGSGFPVLLAIDGRFRCTRDQVDRALFGSYVEGVDGRVVFKPDGEFAKPKETPPTFSGVLFYREVGFGCPAEPVFFLHPRERRTLPANLNVLEQRFLPESRLLISTLPTSTRVLAALRPLNLSAIPA